MLRKILIILSWLGLVGGITVLVGVRATEARPAVPLPVAPPTVQLHSLRGKPAFKVFTDKEGLPQNSCNAIAVDQQGYLWCGTQYGAVYYNGRTWTTVHMPNRALSNYVTAILPTPDGKIWFGTQGAGLVCLNKGEWQTYDEKSGVIPSNRIRALLFVPGRKPEEKNGTLWVGTEKGLCTFDGAYWSTLTSQNTGLKSNHIRCLLSGWSPDGKDVLWVGTDAGGLSQLREGTWTTFAQENSGLPNNTVFDLLETAEPDGKHLLWVGTDDGLAVFSDGQWSHLSTFNSPLPHHIVNALAETVSPEGKHSIWIGTLGGGLSCLDEPTQPTASTNPLEGHTWTVFNSTNSDFPDFIQVLEPLQDESGASTLWGGTNGGGIFRADLGRWEAWDERFGGLPHRIVRVVRETLDEQGRPVLWFGTWGGLARRAETGATTVLTTKNSGLPDDKIEMLYETRSPDGTKNLWVGTVGGGMACLRKGQWTTFRIGNSPLPGNRISGFLETTDIAGRRLLWIGTYDGGFACLDLEAWERGQGAAPGAWVVFTTANSKLPYIRVEFFAHSLTPEGKPQIWLGTNGGGLVRLDFSKVQPVAGTAPPGGDLAGSGFRESFTWKLWNTHNSQLPNDAAQCFWETRFPDGSRRIWLGTSGGAVSFNPENEAAPWFFVSETTQPGLINNLVSTICEDAFHRIYLCTFKGIVCLTPRGSSQGNPAEYDRYVYMTDDGLPGNGINPRSAVFDRDGGLWVGTLYGAARLPIRPPASTPPSPKPLRLERVAVNGKPLVNGSFSAKQTDGASVPRLSIEWPQQQVFPYFENNFIFEYALLSRFRETDTEYATQLTGFEETPSAWTTDFKKEYTNLGAGAYEFKVWGRDYSGNVSGPATLSFRVKAAPWRTWWAYGAYVLILGGIGYGAALRRIQTLRHRQEQELAHFKQLQEERLDHLREMQAQRIVYLQEMQEARIASLRQLLESIRVINSQLDLMTVLQNIAEESARLISAEPGGIGLVENNEVVFSRLWQRGEWRETNLRFPMGEGTVGHVAQTAQPLIVNDPETSPYIKYADHIRRNGVIGLLDVPILARTGRVVGVLHVRRPLTRGPFTEPDAQLLESLAHQAAVAVEKAFLYREMEKLYQHEQEVSRTLTELNQMKTNFIVVTSHEMRTPLTVIKGYSEALLEEYLGPLTPAQKKSLEACQRMVDRLVSSFNNILEMLKINEGRLVARFEPVNLSSVIGEVVAELLPFADQRGQKLITRVPPEVWLPLDRSKMELVFLNLIQNAIKFTYDDGVIEVTVVEETAEVRVSVSDTGLGLDEGDLRQIFEMFYTSPDTSTHSSGKFEFSARGTGLGLAIVKGYVEAHQGRIWVESQGKGKGSCFHFVLPKKMQNS
ncbi:MAG: GAF domain-containing protein [Blastocatellia bacterium]|nr:GAF domain-containing protein [Blastocatellia bacterium]